MNCRNHPETPATAYCQYCGKPLCEACVRRVGNVVSCEPCLLSRLGGTSFSQTQGEPPAYPQGSYTPPPHASPGLALVLGFIPGVGAMYNGQFAKGLAHVLVFALLVDLSHYNGLLGIVVAAWVFYQVFDAYQTAVARRDGLPLPNPLGLNHVGQWFGGRAHPETMPGAAPVESPRETATAPHNAPGGPVSTVPPEPLVSTAPPLPPGWKDNSHARAYAGVPTGAIVLIGLGVAFLLGNLGVLREDWIARGWPLLLIAIGVWMALERGHRGRAHPPGQKPPTGGIE